MTTAQIEALADSGGLSGPDMNLGAVLRRKVIPEFFRDVGPVGWARKVGTLAISSAAREYALAADFSYMVSMVLSDKTSEPLVYIGEDPEKVMAAECSTTPGRPSGYYFSTVTPEDLEDAAELYQKLKFDCLPDASYAASYIYRRCVPFSDDTTSVNMDHYVPVQAQWALVEALKMEIMRDRFGIEDPRFVAASAAYQAWIARIGENKEQAARSRAIFVS